MIPTGTSFRKRARGLTYAGIIAVCVTALATGGCYTRSIIPAQNLSRITVPNHTRELLLRDRQGRTVRVGPNSKIRFLVRGGRWTPWVEGRQLLVNRAGANVHLGPEAPRLLARWSDIFAAEVRNLSGPKTYGAILVTTVLVGVVVLLIVGSAKGGGKGLGKIFAGVGKGVARGLARGALHHGFRLGVRIPHVHVSPGTPGPVDTTNQPPSSADPPPSGAPGAPPPPPPPPPPTGDPNIAAPATPPGPSPALGTARPPTAWTTPLPAFSRLTNRRAGIRLVGAVGVGTDLTTHDSLSSAAFLGFRAYNAFEMAVGARLYRHRGTRASTSQGYHTSWMAVLRIGAHLDLDARRWVALPIGVDVGGGDALIHIRINLGIRIRLTRWLHLGIYPFNPTYTHFKDDTLKQDIAWWSFPTELELAFTF